MGKLNICMCHTCVFVCACMRFLKVPWKAWRSNQSILKEMNAEYSLEMNADAEADAPTLWPSDVKS